MIVGRALRLFARISSRFADVLDPPPPPPPPPVVPEPPPPTQKELSHARWVADQGDKTLRVDYPLTPSDIVVDLGGYEGQWASDIFSRYVCTVHIVEPVKPYADAIRLRFRGNERIHLHELALGAEFGELHLSLSGDASSAFKSSEGTVTAMVVPFSAWMTEQGIGRIGLLKINIEGGEYDLLEHLIESGCVLNIENIQVQFHDFVPDSDERMSRIQAELSKTHERTYHYFYVWENWRRK